MGFNPISCFGESREQVTNKTSVFSSIFFSNATFHLLTIPLFWDENSTIIQLKNPSTFVLSACCSCKLLIWINMCKKGDTNATMHTGGACVNKKGCNLLQFLYFFSSHVPAPACLILVLTIYTSRWAFLPYFRLWALHAFLPEISLLVAFILNYIHMLDIAS